MKFPCILKSALLIIRDHSDLSFATKRIGLPCCAFVTITTCFSLQITLLSNYLLLIISVLADNTLLKTTCHFLLLLVGFGTLTYRKDYNWSLYLWVINDFLRCVCWDPMNCEFMIRSIHEYYLSSPWNLLCMIFVASYFFYLLVLIGQLDWFFFWQWERCFVMGSILRCSILGMEGYMTHMYHCY